MAENKRITLTCQKCGKVFQSRPPAAPGYYSVTCPNPDCKEKVKFRFRSENESGQNNSDHSAKTDADTTLGLLDNGNYRFRCNNDSCRKYVVVPKKMLKPGHNTALCPGCKSTYEFDIEPTEEDLLKCQYDGCDGVLAKPDRGDGIYTATCGKCDHEYNIFVENGKVVKVSMKTYRIFSSKKDAPMKLVSGTFLGKKEYMLSKGVHYVGRLDDRNISDFSIKDKYASARSVRIDVNENGGKLIYRMTVERAMNPVYHNNSELTVGDIVYLTYGDTIKLGKTLIKVQKVKP